MSCKQISSLVSERRVSGLPELEIQGSIFTRGNILLLDFFLTYTYVKLSNAKIGIIANFV